MAERHYFKELRLQQFRGLQAIIRLGSFSAAARDLGLTKASVWQQVRALEEEFGCKLVESLGRKAQPTPEGLRLARLSSPLVEGFDSLKKVFHDEHGKAERHLRMAAPATVVARGTSEKNKKPQSGAHKMPVYSKAVTVLARATR